MVVAVAVAVPELRQAAASDSKGQEKLSTGPRNYGTVFERDAPLLGRSWAGGADRARKKIFPFLSKRGGVVDQLQAKSFLFDLDRPPRLRH